MTLRAWTLLGTALAGMAAPALAQEGSGQSSSEATPVDETVGIQDIVVTAQRREENLQNVPLAVTALTGDALAKNDIRDLSRVEVLTPGFSFGRSGSDARPAIRGVRTENVAASGDPSIGFYVDNIYQSRAAQANVPFVDVERVEIQRGPQGTLYGRNTFGGNITLTSATPRDDFAAGVNLLYGSFDRRRADGFVNVPLADGIALRFAGLREKMDGYVKGINKAHDIYDRDTSYFRAGLRVAPDDSGFEAVLRYSYWLEKGTGGGAFGYRVGGIYVNPATGANDINGVPLLINPKALDGIADVAGVDKGFPIIDRKLFYPGNHILEQKVQQHQLSANLSYDFGPVVIRSITGYTDFEAYRTADNDFSPRVTTCGATQTSVCTFDAQDDRLHTFSQEVQLASSGNQRFSWIVGGFYYHDNIYRADFYNLAETNPNGTAINAHPRIKSYAGFGQASYWLVPDVLRLTGGIRYTSDRKRITRDIATIVNGRITTIAPNINAATGAPFTPLNFKFNKTTWRANAEYHPTDRSMLYATISTGFRSGGFNGGNFTNPAIPGSFGPETVTAYEVGSKNRFLDNTMQLNLSAYWNDFKNLQVQNQFLVPNAGGGFTTSSAILNAATARAKGIEAELVYEPVVGLNISGSATMMTAKYRDYSAAPAPALYTTPPVTATNPKGGFDLSGNRVPYQPKFKLTGSVSYDIDLGGAGTITPQATVLISGSYFLTDFNKALDYQRGFTKLDLRLGWVSRDERFSLEGFVNNVTNKITLNRATFGSGGLNQNYDAPRMYGVRAGAKF
jgi:iron complex outermembrane receptor protein